MHLTSLWSTSYTGDDAIVSNPFVRSCIAQDSGRSLTSVARSAASVQLFSCCQAPGHAASWQSFAGPAWFGWCCDRLPRHPILLGPARAGAGYAGCERLAVPRARVVRGGTNSGPVPRGRILPDQRGERPDAGGGRRRRRRAEPVAPRGVNPSRARFTWRSPPRRAPVTRIMRASGGRRSSARPAQPASPSTQAPAPTGRCEGRRAERRGCRRMLGPPAPRRRRRTRTPLEACLLRQRTRRPSCSALWVACRQREATHG